MSVVKRKFLLWKTRSEFEFLRYCLHRLPKNSLAVMPLPLYAGLTIEEQLQVFEPTPKYTRKVIVSTNIAEASVTLEGVVYVIDTGFVKVSV